MPSRKVSAFPPPPAPPRRSPVRYRAADRARPPARRWRSPDSRLRSPPRRSSGGRRRGRRNPPAPACAASTLPSRISHASVGTGGGDFVQTVRAVDHEAALHAERRQRSRHQFRRMQRGRADELRRRPRRVGQRPEQIEHRAHLEIGAHRVGVLHGGVDGRGEEEADAHFADGAGRVGRRRSIWMPRLPASRRCRTGSKSSGCRAWRRARPRPPPRKRPAWKC